MFVYSLYESCFFMLLYGFLGWAAEVAFYSIRDRHFVNRGLINLPCNVPCGICFAILIQLLPSMGRNVVLQFVTAAIVYEVAESLSGTVNRFVSGLSRWEAEAVFTGTVKSWVRMVGFASIAVLDIYVVQPILMAGISLIPRVLFHVLVWAGMIWLILDFLVSIYGLRHSKKMATGEASRSRTQKIADGISAHLWKRLSRAYPGIKRTDGESDGEPYVFARGICWDKLIWVFLISAFLGDLIEMLFCGLVNEKWMSRSSVLYGPFSFVWGLGAVVLTVVLRTLMEKPDRYIFVAGFFIGGAYEYICSVFTEVVFGTVFWDYSKVPLNIGGRTNLTFCLFWGILAVVWVKILYPRLSSLIERTPPLAGKIITWIIVFFMACNGILTGAAMMRYNTRRERPESRGIIEEFLDTQYDDEFMEKRWPNMRLRTS